MEAGRGRRAAVIFCAVLVTLTTFTTAGCDIEQLGGDALEAAKVLPGPGGVAETGFLSLLSMDMEEDFVMGSPPAE